MYGYIVNPNTKRRVSIYSSLGKELISNYKQHFYLKTGGSAIGDITAVVAFENIGYYYFKAPINKERINQSELKKLRDLGYLDIYYHNLAESIRSKISEVNQEVLQANNLLDELEKQSFTISNKEELEFSKELDYMGLSGGAGLAASLLIRVGGTSMCFMIGNYLYQSLFPEDDADRQTTNIQVPNVSSIPDTYDIVFNAQNIKVDKINIRPTLTIIKKNKLFWLKKLQYYKTKISETNKDTLIIGYSKLIESSRRELKKLIILEEKLTNIIKNRQTDATEVYLRGS